MKIHFNKLALFSLMLLTACGSTSKIRRYYVVEMPSEMRVDKADTTTYDLKVDVRNFWAAPAFDQTRIALRTRSHELSYFYYHHWAVKPSTAVANMVYEWIQKRNIFSRLSRGISYNPDFLIVGEIKSIERTESKDGIISSHIHIRLELRDDESDIALVQFETDQYQPLGDDTSMNNFARKSSKMIIAITQEFVDRVEAYMKTQTRY